MPQFPGGAEELEKYIKENRQYPAKTKKEDKEGSCYVQAVVEKDGRLTDIHLLRGIIGKNDLNEDALRIVNSMPNWIPGKQNNKLVRVTTIIVIYY
jgi:protein TonB